MLLFSIKSHTCPTYLDVYITYFLFYCCFCFIFVGANDWNDDVVVVAADAAVARVVNVVAAVS